jgi:hypothetical protein
MSRSPQATSLEQVESDKRIPSGTGGKKEAGEADPALTIVSPRSAQPPSHQAVERRRRSSSLACFLPKNFGRFLIIPQSQKDRMAQAIIPGPFRKFNFANDGWFNPNAPSHFDDA